MKGVWEVLVRRTEKEEKNGWQKGMSERKESKQFGVAQRNRRERDGNEESAVRQFVQMQQGDEGPTWREAHFPCAVYSYYAGFRAP